MKQLSIILLLFIYVPTTFGLGLKEFYCCGKLKSVSIAVTNIEKDQSAKENNKGCCKTKFQFHKSKDKHLVSGQVLIPVVQVIAELPQYLAFRSILLKKKPVIINGSHAPPLYTGVPVYISNCVYRI